jgi:3-oxoacyl-[acyl-carrier protein] reductase
LKKKNVIVVGGTGGLGFEVCSKLIKEGYYVTSFGRNSESLNKLSEIGCSVVEIDFNKNCWMSKFSKYVENVDVLINSAGIFELKNIHNSQENDFDKMFNINVKVPFMTMKMCLSSMEKAGAGRVINVLSSSAYNASGETGLYCASKYALLGLTRSAFLEYRDKGIYITSVSPGSIRTKMGELDYRQDTSSFIEPKELAELIVSLLMFDSSMIVDEVRLSRTVIM